MPRSGRAAAIVITVALGAWPSAQAPSPSATGPAAPAAPQGGAAQPTAAPQPQGQLPTQPPTFRTEANFVRVDVYPTKDGQPVLDLTAADFEVAEDGVAQKVSTFEHVVVRPAGPQADRIEPSSNREMLEAAANPRNRVFVLFLDTTHVRFQDSHAITEPLIRLINRILGPDDLIGVMTPDMSVKELVLGRRTEVTEERLRTHWRWGSRFEHMNDEREDAYEACYPSLGGGDTIAADMIARKRERESMEALQDVVRYLAAIREERKAIITVTDGWALFTPNRRLESDAKHGVPTVDPVGVGPGGQLTTKNPLNRDNNNSQTKMECDADRLRLANIDDEKFLRDIVGDANRGNATFYPVDPRGLVVFQNDISAGVPPGPDAAMRRTHENSIRTLADATDGIAVVDTNDLDKGLRKISDDLSSYYLLGYYTTNGKTDGGYRTLKVRVTRPGVAVRARRGYRAASAEEVAKSRAADAAPKVDIATPLASALNALAEVRADARVRMRATLAPGGTLLWVTGELSATAGRSDDWGQGATADLQITSAGLTGSSRVVIKPGERSFTTSLKLTGTPAATIDIQTRVSPADGGSAATDTLHLPASPQPLFYRRGPTTGNRQMATADVRFSRADRVHLELPVDAEGKPGPARLLDRTGQPLAVPVTVGERTDEAGGQRWVTADVVLAPLAPADYIVELTMSAKAGESRIVSAIRVVR